MSRQCYIDKNFKHETLHLITIINNIVDEYQADGYVLTVRQLYYQLVARDIIPNTLQEYKRAAGIINDAKLAGMIAWDMIEDRTREFVRRQRWDSGQHILRSCIHSYHKDLWHRQEHRVFVIIEKEALVGVLEGVCNELDIPILAARGYPSSSVLREFALQDIIPAIEAEQIPIILHLGDHDPSGLDMTRDLEERIALFSECAVELRRIALNMEQVEKLRPPENPAKTTDSRFANYRRKFGDSSWELDALTPDFLNKLVRKYAMNYLDEQVWQETKNNIESTREKITALANEFED